ncbi:MAG: TVP38/TMEM64 family protein [Acidobacteriota bacterium]
MRRALVAVLSLIVLITLVSTVDLGSQLDRLVKRVEELGPWAPVLFLLLHAGAVVTLVPGILFPLGAGFLFGVGGGTALSVLGKVTGSALSFLIARYLLQGLFPAWSERFRDGHPGFRKLLEGLPRGGWKTVLQIRLVPLIPFKVSSYLFGWTDFRFRDYVLGTAIATIPFSLLNAYLGSVAADLTQLRERALPETPTEWSLYLGGLALSVLACWFLVRRARELLSRTN